MKKSLITLTIMLAATAMIAVFSCPALANVGGQCSNCHTMHYSQEGTSTIYESGGPFGALLTGTCIGCHTTDGTDPLDNTFHTPFVKSTSSTGFSDDNCLAGGFFGDMGTGSNDDNHHGVAALQISTPAGYDSGGSFAYTGATNGLGCAGTNGCHGKEDVLSDMDAIKGGHHATSSTYRMLYVGTDTVSGDPAVDYEEAIIATPSTGVNSSGTNQNINVYSAGTLTSATEATISALCAKCHGVFHGSTTSNTDGEWIRHPSDEPLPSHWAKAGASYTYTGTDAKENPLGFKDADIAQTTQATCLSCHRAHGTENADLLRWAYDTQLAGQAAGSEVTYGCLGCHDAQR